MCVAAYCSKLVEKPLIFAIICVNYMLINFLWVNVG